MAGYTGGLQQYDSNSYGGQPTPRGGYGLMNTAQGLMDRPYGGMSPMGPAGITDLERQGQLTQLQGMGSQYAPAQQYAQNMGQYAQGAQQNFLKGMQSGQFGWNPQMQQSANMAGQAAGSNPYANAAASANRKGMNQPGFGQSNQMYSQSVNQPGFGQSDQLYSQSANQPGFGQANQLYGQSTQQPGFGFSNQMYGQSTQQPGFGFSNQMYGQSTQQPNFQDAARGAYNTMSNYGGGYSNQMADNINRTSASFNPWNDQLEGAIGSANRQLARDFNQQVMPEMNRAAIGSGPGAYGGTRAGVAQGLREQGLADAMQRQTTDMSNAGYEAGLNRYVQDRATTVGATNEAMRTGGSLGMQGSQLLGNLGNMQGNLQQGAASGWANNAANQGNLMQGAASGWANNALGQGNLQQGAASGLSNNALGQGNLQQGAARGIGTNTQNQAGNYLQGAANMGNLSQQLRNAQLGAANQLGSLGSTSLQQNNAMNQWGWGTMMPNSINQAYQAALQPGQIQKGMGQAMQGFGQGQQAQNQRVQDWYNGQYNAAQNYPQDRFNNYVNQTGQFLTAGGQTPVQQPGRNPYADAVGAGSAGYGLYNAWNQNRQGPAGVPAGQSGPVTQSGNWW